MYTSTVKIIGGREGKVISSDGHLDINLSKPKELGGPGGNGTNPEQLFAAGYGACFDGAINVAARNKRIKIGTTELNTSVTIHKDDETGFYLSVVMKAHIPGVSVEVAKELIQDAHQICPYSKSIRGNVEVELKVVY